MLHIPDDPVECRRLLDDLLRSHDALRQQAEAEQRAETSAGPRRPTPHRRAGTHPRGDRRRLRPPQGGARRAGRDPGLAPPLRLRPAPRTPRRRPGPGPSLRPPRFAPEPEPLRARAGRRRGAAAIPAGPLPAADPPRSSPAHPHRARPHRRGEDLLLLRGRQVRIGEDESRELEFIPARLEVQVHVLPKYACPKCRDGVASPPVPPKPMPGGIAGPGLVAFVVVSKFADHLPLYRLEDILTRHGVFLSRSTLCDWVRDAAMVLEPLAALQKALVLQSPVIWTDDTPVTVLGGDEPGSTTGRFWAYIGDDGHPYTVYDFSAEPQPRRPGGVPAATTAASSRPMPMGATTGSSSPPTAVSWKWPAGRTRGASSSTRGPMHRGRPTRSWSGSASSTTSRTGRGCDGRGAAGAAPAGVGADPRSDRGVAGRAVGSGAAQVGVGQGGDLRAEPVGGVAAVHQRRPADDRQQRLGANATAAGHRSEELAVPGECGGGPASGGAVHDPGGSEAAPPGAVGVSAGRVAAAERRGDGPGVVAAGPVGGEPSGVRAAAPTGRVAAARRRGRRRGASVGERRRGRRREDQRAEGRCLPMSRPGRVGGRGSVRPRRRSARVRGRMAGAARIDRRSEGLDDEPRGRVGRGHPGVGGVAAATRPPPGRPAPPW